MSIPGRGKWAWDRFRLEPTLWDLMYHGDPFQHIEDPRKAVAVHSPREHTPQIGAPPVAYFDPGAIDVDEHSQNGRVQHDLEVYDLAFGR